MGNEMNAVNLVKERFVNVLMSAGVPSDKVDSVADELLGYNFILEPRLSVEKYFVDDPSDEATAPGLTDEFVSGFSFFARRSFTPETCSECETGSLTTYDEANNRVSCPGCGEVWDVHPATSTVPSSAFVSPINS